MNRIRLGNLGGGRYGARVSKPGYNVDTADVDGLLFDDLYPLLRSLGYFTISFSAGGTNTPAAINHGLGYRPQVLLAFTDRNTGRTYDAANHYGVKVTSTQIIAMRNATGASAMPNLTVIIQACTDGVA